jgi:hypothetical protein
VEVADFFWVFAAPTSHSLELLFYFAVAPKVQVQKALVGAPLFSNVKLKCDVEAFPNSNNYWVKEHDEVLLNG